MKKVLMIANTVYQIIVAIQLKHTVLKDMEVDLLISDHSVDVEKYTVSGKKTELFHDIIYIETKEYSHRKGKYAKISTSNEKLFCMSRYWEVFRRQKKIKRYDYLFCANIDAFSIAVYDALNMLNHNNTKFFMFEDGISSYYVMEEIYNYHKNEIENSEYSAIYQKMGYGKLVDQICGIFLFNPPMFAWKKQIKRYGIPKINKDNLVFKQQINMFFGYKNDISMFKDKKLLFFEECFCADGFAINDVQIVNKLAEVIGKDNIIVKTHPRNPVNRFKDYAVYSDTSVPWEIIFLNYKFDHMILSSLSSSSVFNPYLLFDDRRKILILQDLIDGMVTVSSKKYQLYLKETIVSKHKDIYIAPEKMEDIDEAVKYINSSIR